MSAEGGSLHWSLEQFDRLDPVKSLTVEGHPSLLRKRSHRVDDIAGGAGGSAEVSVLNGANHHGGWGPSWALKLSGAKTGTRTRTFSERKPCGSWGLL